MILSINLDNIMGKIATYNWIYSKFSVGNKYNDKCPTKTEIESLKLLVNSSYSSNQLVQQSDITENTYKLTILGFTNLDQKYVICYGAVQDSDRDFNDSLYITSRVTEFSRTNPLRCLKNAAAITTLEFCTEGTLYELYVNDYDEWAIYSTFTYNYKDITL